jgi:FkbM family methyltransferase
MVIGRGFSTATKIRIARWLGRAVRTARLIAGRRSPEVDCWRNGIRLSLDLREGVQLALYLGVYERTTERRLREFVHTGMTVVDIGANIGAHALPLALAVGSTGRVIAVEPTVAAFERLCRNRDLNPEVAARLITVHAAVGAPNGALKSTYYSEWPLEDAGVRHPVHHGAEQTTGNATFSTLDDLVDTLHIDRVGVIKIDVDGTELEVLDGSRRVIERDRPTVFFELCPYLLTEFGRSAHDLVTFFTSLGYELYDERTLRPLGRDAARIVASVPPLGGRNVIARGADVPPGLSA